MPIPLPLRAPQPKPLSPTDKRTSNRNCGNTSNSQANGSKKPASNRCIWHWIPPPAANQRKASHYTACTNATAQLIRLVQQGTAQETAIALNEDNAWQYLAVRTAQSGWANMPRQHRTLAAYWRTARRTQPPRHQPNQPARLWRRRHRVWRAAN